MEQRKKLPALPHLTPQTNQKNHQRPNPLPHKPLRSPQHILPKFKGVGTMETTPQLKTPEGAEPAGRRFCVETVGAKK
jgi:hypothetical protein